MPRVLIVEDETVLRASMARALVKLPADVVEASTLAEAIASFDRGVPDVIVSDLDLPDGSGIELIGELGRRKLRVPMVFVSAYLRAYRAQIPPHADVEVREKPLSLDDLRELVRERVGGRDTGAAPFAVADYLQLACLGKHSVVIEVTSRGRVRGRVEVVKGDIWHAVDAGGSGAAAFRRLAFGADVEVTCRTLTSAPGPRTIDGHWEALLIDSAREHDEAAWGSDAPACDLELDIDEFEDADVPWPPPAAAPPPAPPPPRSLALGSASDVTRLVADEFAVARDGAVDALLSRDFASAAHLFTIAHALRPDDRAVAANLERLAALGHIPAPVTEEDHDA